MQIADRIPAPSTPGLAVVLVRHGETDDNLPPLRFQGRRDTPLNETGRAQMRRLASGTQTGYAGLLSSDLDRAVESARIVGGSLGLEPQLDPRWSESHRGRWEGLPMDDVASAEPELWAAWRATDPAFRFPGGESLAEHRDRVRAALSDALAAEGPVVVVCHGGTIRLLLEPDLAHFHDLELPNAAVIGLGRDGEPIRTESQT